MRFSIFAEELPIRANHFANSVPRETVIALQTYGFQRKHVARLGVTANTREILGDYSSQRVAIKHRRERLGSNSLKIRMKRREERRANFALRSGFHRYYR